MCVSKADGGRRCSAVPNTVVNARRRVARTYQLLLEAKKDGDNERIDKLAKRFDRQVKESLEAERGHVSHFVNPYGRMDEEEVREVIERRINNPEFKELLAKRDKARTELQEARDKVDDAFDKYKETGDEADYQEVRKARFESAEAYFAYLDARADLDEYKDNTALAAARLAEITSFEKEHEGDTLGNTIKTVTYPSGSREWLEQRQNGIGGSDVGDILKLDPRYGDSGYREVLASKTEQLTDEQVAEQEANHVEFSGAAGRGDAWEPIIAQRFAEENPQYTLIHSKSSWVNPERPWQFANVDGILSDREDGEPNGILEIKTASDASEWEDGVPLGYRAQVLHYLDATGFKYAHVAVLIDDHEYRSYRINANEPFNPNDPASPTYAEARPELEQFWAKVEGIKNSPKKSVRRNKSHFSWDSSRRDVVVREVSAWRQEPESVVRARIEQRIAAGEKASDVIRSEYTSHDPSTRTKDLVSVDLETSGYSPETGEIIEIGITRRNYKGEVVDSYQEIFGMDERALRVNGTGAQSVHNISPDDVRGKRKFRDPEVQKRVQGLFKDAVMVAHNAPFEKKWLNQSLDGFHESKIPVVDTMRLSRYFAHDTENNKLETFAPRYGVPYNNAHRALADAEMTADALHNFTEEITGKKLS